MALKNTHQLQHVPTVIGKDRERQQSERECLLDKDSAVAFVIKRERDVRSFVDPDHHHRVGCNDLRTEVSNHH